MRNDGEMYAAMCAHLLRRAWFMLAYVAPRLAVRLSGMLADSGYWAAKQAVPHVREALAALQAAGEEEPPHSRPEDPYVFYGVLMEAVYFYAMYHNAPGFAQAFAAALADARAEEAFHDPVHDALLAYWGDLADELASWRSRAVRVAEESEVPW